MRSRFRALVLALVGAALLSGPVYGQVNVRGQILLPNGNVPTEPIRFELDAINGLHDIRFTDSNGRFILERLDPNIEYTIVVSSDDIHWGNTQVKFIPSEMDSQRFYLNPLPLKKGPPPATVSANGSHIPTPEAAELYDHGMKSYREGHVEPAVGLLNAAIVKDPKYVVAYNDLGVMLMRQRKYSEAEQIFRRGLEQDQKSADLQANLGAALNHQNHFAEAIAPLREALRLNPKLPDAHLQLGVSLVETDDLKTARQELIEAKNEFGDRAAKSAILQMYLGELYARTGEFPLAIAAFNSYLELAPDSPNATPIKALIVKMQTELAKKN